MPAMNRSRHDRRAAAKVRVDRTDSNSAVNWLGDLRVWWDGKAPVWRFGLKFALLMAIFYVLVLTPWSDRLVYAYLEANARLANAVLVFLGQGTAVNDLTVRSARFAIKVQRGCDAIEPAYFFCAAVFSFPGSAGPKALACVAGTLLLQALNLVRIVSLYFIGAYFPGLFPAAHLEIWPAVFIVMALLLWMRWIGWAQRPSLLPTHVARS